MCSASASASASAPAPASAASLGPRLVSSSLFLLSGDGDGDAEHNIFFFFFFFFFFSIISEQRTKKQVPGSIPAIATFFVFGFLDFKDLSKSLIPPPKFLSFARALCLSEDRGANRADNASTLVFFGEASSIGSDQLIGSDWIGSDRIGSN
jgi:hypothetical protein